MDKPTAKDKPKPKQIVKGKGDGLSKKDRRALTVEEKQQQQVIPAKTDCNNKPVSGGAITTKTQAETTTSSTIVTKQPAALTEKQLRKLEWEKKLAEQATVNKDVVTDPASNATAATKAQLRLQRREQQEAQRKAKSDNDSKKKPISVSSLAVKPTSPVVTGSAPTDTKPTVDHKKATRKTTTPSAHPNKVQLVHHLYTEHANKSDYDKTIVNFKGVHHPVFVRLGVQYATKQILGSNARCLALLAAVRCLIRDLQTPSKQEFCRHFEACLQTCVSYLQYCRPFSVSMTNALRHFKVQLTQEATKLRTDNDKKLFLLNVLDTYIHDDIDKAGEAISLSVNEKIANGDVILTYGCSSLIKKILLDAHKQGKRFQVIVADGRPFCEGRQMLTRLIQHGIPCSYVYITALSYVMSSVTKCLLGAHALLANGYVMSRIGTSQIALVAQAYNKPVLVCCETYKFSERVQTDSFVYNEIGDPDMLTLVDTVKEPSPLLGWQDNNKLTPLNLFYDVTPPDLVTAVVTELAILPCTSVPVVLRIKPTELLS